MKAIILILLGMLLTSVVGISYASPVVQPNGDNCNPNNPNANGGECGAHAGGYDPPHHGCFVGRNGPEGTCCLASIPSYGFEISDVEPAIPCVQHL